ncbi:MAG: DNA mismatch endonuclease Vsr [SAR202 cluster bacterium]|nr:DNA mismatch endonuclease Vsr [SAR202 cluster bacterium]
MGRVRSKDTKSELAVRKALHAAGFRYRLHDRKLPGRPDIALPRFRTAVFVQGCFWHGHGCKRSAAPTSNIEFWSRKLARNVERDAAHRQTLEQAGWNVEVVWQCELCPATERLVGRLTQLREQQSGG